MIVLIQIQISGLQWEWSHIEIYLVDQFFGNALSSYCCVSLHLRSFASILMVLSKINRKKKLQKANNRPILLQAKWRINLLIE